MCPFHKKGKNKFLADFAKKYQLFLFLV